MAAAELAQTGESKGERLPWKTVPPFYSMQGDHECFVLWCLTSVEAYRLPITLT